MEPTPADLATLEAKVKQLEKELDEGTSRTGEPLIPPRVFKVVALVYGALVVTLGTLLGFFPDVRALQVVSALLVALGPVLGIASPGLRKVAIVLLLVGVTFTGSGCALSQRVGKTAELAAPQLIDCTLEAGKEAFPAMVAEVFGQLMAKVDGGSFEVEPVIDELLAKAQNPFLPCVISAVLQAWVQAGSGAGVEMPATAEKARLLLLAAHRGQAHLLARGYVCR